ncbi:diacylglycerol kinase 4-like [Zingiber officinale]|uniref:diacylglycerol kinase 4-like n=1 Tax=Zingiber officinale TaxID=94328 RepID=UPI001C4D68B4|nr:diacylglycerol kinase 4-like [Zingiber officinale]XP_042431128.1 diacylglycerol kinase 4-like [Zingiber officinale]
MPRSKPTRFWKHVRLTLLNSSSSDRSRAIAVSDPTTTVSDDEEYLTLNLADSLTTFVTTPSMTDCETDSSSSTPSRNSAPPSRSSSIKDYSLGGCGLGKVDKDNLRRRVMIPDRLAVSIVEAVRSRNIAAGLVAEAAAREVGWEDEDPPESPLVLFINSRSGGRLGSVLKGRLENLIGADQVFDLSVTKPSDFVQFGLACLERMADLGDDCAKATRENMRVMVAGGDGTVGWVLGSLGQLYEESREPILPIGIIPLGTGNDLSRSFGWGGSFPLTWRSAVKRSLYKAITGPICRLDSWHIVVSVPVGDLIKLPHSLRHLGESTFTPDGYIEGLIPETMTCFDGAFYNYFSIGMDAQVAYDFHQLRDEKPYLAQGPLTNKLIYTGYTCKQGWFFTPCISDPSLRGLKHILRLSVKRINCLEWEQIPVPSSVRAIVMLNLHNYASGRNPWGNLKPEYLEKRGFVEAQMDDGLLEIFGFKQGWHASLVMVEIISAKHIAQASAIRLEIRGGEWRNAYMQMDGEPWKQSMNTEYSSFVEIKRVPYHSLIINGE